MDKRFLWLAAWVLVLQFVINANTYLLWTAKGFILMFIIPALLILFTKTNPSKFGFNFNNIKQSIIYAIIIVIVSLPFLFYFSTEPSFKAYYPLWKNQMDFIPAELLLFFSMIGIELFFRGFLLNIAIKYVNWKYAVILQAVLYMLVHIGKPFPEVFLSLFAGLAFGYAAFKTKSIMPSLISHYSIAVIFDILTI